MLAEIAAGFAATTSAIEIAKGLKAIVDKVGDAEAKLQVAELISKLADAKLEAAASVARIAELEQQLVLTESMTFDGMLYWQEEGNDTAGPFCQRCFDADGKAVRLQEGFNRYHPPWHCTVCSKTYGQGDPLPEPSPDPGF